MDTPAEVAVPAGGDNACKAEKLVVRNKSTFLFAHYNNEYKLPFQPFFLMLLSLGLAYGHTTLSTPDLVRAQKLSRVGAWMGDLLGAVSLGWLWLCW